MVALRPSALLLSLTLLGCTSESMQTSEIKTFPSEPDFKSASRSDGYFAMPSFSGSPAILLEAQKRVHTKFDVARKPSVAPTDFVKKPWDHSLPFLSKEQKAAFSSDFGWRSLWGRRDFHGGIDVMAPKGTPIKAITNGKIIYLEKAGKNGGVVIEGMGKHKGHFFTYWHMSPARGWAEGDVIRQGQKIGALANWGANTHLHYAVHKADGSNYKARTDKNAVHPLLYHSSQKLASR